MQETGARQLLYIYVYVTRDIPYTVTKEISAAPSPGTRLLTAILSVFVYTPIVSSRLV